MKFLPRLFWQTWPCDNDGYPLDGDGTEQSRWVGDFLKFQWGAFGFTFYGKNYRARK